MPGLFTPGKSPAGSPEFFTGQPSYGPVGTITGITKDSTGVILGSCTVKLYRSRDDTVVAATTSDATTGVYTFKAMSLGETYYVVAYKVGAPDVAGTTINTLIPSSA